MSRASRNGEDVKDGFAFGKTSPDGAKLHPKDDSNKNKQSNDKTEKYNGEDNEGIVYKITCKVTNKIYIGQTRKYGCKKGAKVKMGIKRRWYYHVYTAMNKIKDCPYISKAIRKYGPDNFTMEVICRCRMDELNEKEIYYIAQHDCLAPKGYNCSIGGDSPNLNALDKAKMLKSISEKAKIRWQQPGFREKLAVKISGITQKRMWDPEIREAMLKSLAKKRKVSLPSNIYPIQKKNVLVGYYAKIQINKINYAKSFAVAKYTLKQNLEQAKKFLESIKQVKIVENVPRKGRGITRSQAPKLTTENGYLLDKDGYVKFLFIN